MRSTDFFPASSTPLFPISSARLSQPSSRFPKTASWRCFSLCVVPFNVALSRLFSKKIRKRYRELREHTESMSSRLATMLEMLTVTKAHGLEQTEISAVNSSISGVANAGKKVDLTGARFGSWAWCLNTFLSAACMVFAPCLPSAAKFPWATSCCIRRCSYRSAVTFPRSSTFCPRSVPGSTRFLPFPES